MPSDIRVYRFCISAVLLFTKTTKKYRNDYEITGTAQKYVCVVKVFASSVHILWQVLYKCNIEVLDLNRSLKPRSMFGNV